MSDLVAQILLHSSTSRSLPPLTRSDNVNAELYLLMALVVRQFVQSWYRKISDDPTFTLDIVDTMAHMIGVLESRALTLDWDQVVLDNVPYIVHNHIQEYNLAAQAIESNLVNDSIETVFAKRRPHPALQSSESEQLFLKLLAKGMTVALLDSRNLKSDLARAFLSSIINDIVLHNAVSRLSEPWFLHEVITKLIVASVDKKDNNNSDNDQDDIERTTPSRFSFRKSAVYFQKLSLLAGKVFSLGLLIKDSWVTSQTSATISATNANSSSPNLPSRYIFSAIKSLLNLDSTNPLFCHLTYMVSLPFRIEPLASITKNGASYLLASRLLHGHSVATICRVATQSLFSNNGFLGPPRVIPTVSEQAEIKETAIVTILSAFPPPLRPVLLGPDPRATVEHMLLPFSNAAINRHLVYTLLEYVILTLVPELAEYTPTEILNNRLS